MAWTPDSGAVDGIYSASLTSHGSPRGFIALKVVHDGTVTTIARYRFTAFRGRGSLQVRASRRAIAVTWRFPGRGQDVARLVIPPRMIANGAAWSGGSFDSSGSPGEVTVWEQERALGHAPGGPGGSTSMTIGFFDALVSDSARPQYQHRTAYCITLDVGPR